MYFDVRKYNDNITIQEIIPPFINLENYEPGDSVKSDCDVVMDNIYGSERLTITLLNKPPNSPSLYNYNTGYGNVCLYKFILVKEHCIHNDTNTTGLVLEPFEFSIKNNNNPTLSDCHTLLMNPKIIYNIKHNMIIQTDTRNNNHIAFNRIYYNNQLNNIWGDSRTVTRHMTYRSQEGNLVRQSNEPSVKDFLRRYLEYNQKIASTDTNYIKKLTDNKEQIKKELGLFTSFLEEDKELKLLTSFLEQGKESDGFTNNLEKHNYIYFYVIKIDDIWCLRFGLTDQDLFQTFTRQLFIDQFTKNIDTFRLLAIYDYESLTIAENTQRVIKEGLKSFILEENLIISYSFSKSWNLIKTYITNGMLFSKSWIRPELENEIKKILKNP
jgi:hypothetical protein